MKKISLFTICATLFVLAATLNSCTKEDVTVVQKLSDKPVCLPQQQFQATNTDNSFTITQADITAAFSAVGATYSPDKIKNLKVSEVKAKITTTAATFNEIGGFEVYAKGPNTTGDGTQVAYVGNIDNNATEVTLSINGTDIKELLSGTSITFVVRVTNKTNGNAAVCFNLTGGLLQYTVSAK